MPAARAGLLTAWLDARLPRDPQYPLGVVTSCYYDTPQLDSYQDSADGEFAKQKLRLRWYGDPVDPYAGVWLELKSRDGARSVKQRFRYPSSGTPNQLGLIIPEREELASRLHDLTGFAALPIAPTLQPTALIRYERIRWQAADGSVRAALDTNVRTADPRGAPIWLPIRDGSVLELKSRGRAACPDGAPRTARSAPHRAFEVRARRRDALRRRVRPRRLISPQFWSESDVHRLDPVAGLAGTDLGDRLRGISPRNGRLARRLDRDLRPLLIFYRDWQRGAGIHRVFLLAGPAITLLFIAIQWSLPLSLGLLGALSFVRFRTPIKDPAEIGYLLVVIASSIGAATYNYELIGILFAAVALVLIGQRDLRRDRPPRPDRWQPRPDHHDAVGRLHPARGRPAQLPAVQPARLQDRLHHPERRRTASLHANFRRSRYDDRWAEFRTALEAAVAPASVDLYVG